ncbi:HD domain-containing protein [Halalkalibacterium halodurans]|uniref:HD domain-containing protein n=1 Tax=Halalkalibacterium halodurans TaxID=86665 RepID=UPI002E1EF6FA|nr:HD domain-containing protein [Halalkalibacterium halodurans]MED4086651.1 HD domain-containing protein [Halalkalibacterium halodurans]MED4103227.1 HD domain-containing protein [Halalkalibacterium halodurans]MED4108908.1 HD domain-containing protein [Halalkalibacterium halodurans]MED4148645.1 HD domain-containing protein [Halalkalibacterium halodurans]
MTKLYEPFYRLTIELTECEREIIGSRPFKRLAHLHHYGAAALRTPVTHSRYEHTIGVWSLTAHFFPSDQLLRLVALLHDIGHLPFSHAVEQPLGFNHHLLTERLIESQEVAKILKKHGFIPQDVIRRLNENTPVSNQEKLLSLDHLDSFLRDTTLAGTCSLIPHESLGRLSVRGNGIETDEETALLLASCIVKDHELFLDPFNLAMDALLAEAITLYMADKPLVSMENIPHMTDDEVLTLLRGSSNKKVHAHLKLLFSQQPTLVQTDDESSAKLTVTVRKVYEDQPLIRHGTAKGREMVEKKLAELQELKGRFSFVY